MPKVVPNRRYSAEFKVKVIETMRAEGLNYSEAGRRFGIESHCFRYGSGFTWRKGRKVSLLNDEGTADRAVL